MLGFGKDSVNVVIDRVGLVAVFRSADPPLVWKFDLDRNHSFSFKIENEEDRWVLGVLSAANEFTKVARFLKREDALEAFEAVQKALTLKKYSKFYSVTKFLIILLVLGTILYFTGSIITKVSLISSMTPHTGAPAKVPEGIPVPADVYLNPPPPSAPKPNLTPPNGAPVPADEVLQPPR